LASVPEALDANAQPLLTMHDQKNLQKRHQEGSAPNQAAPAGAAP